MIITYNLNFTAPVHFGLEGIGQERVDQTVHSDTLWGAIIDKWLLLYDDLPETLCSASFTVSSCFPVIDGQRYYPVPIGSFDNVLDLVAHQDVGSMPFGIKEIKKIKYIAEPLFFKILTGKNVELADLHEKSVYPNPLEATAQSKKTGCLSMEYQRPRVAVDQLLGGVIEGAFFYCSDQYFAAGAGLFFLASFSDSKLRDRFEGALRLLGDCGIGADRSIGKGQFTCTASELVMPDKCKPDPHVLLSLYYPTREEVAQGIIADEKSSYVLVRRIGHAGSHKVSRYRRADSWMLGEGSILGAHPVGYIPCVLQKSEYVPHDVYRYGKAFCLPMQK